MLKEVKELKVQLKELKEHRVPKVRKELQVRKDYHKEHRVPQELLAHRVFKV